MQVSFFSSPDTDEHFCIYELFNPKGVIIDWAVQDAELVFQVKHIDGYYLDSSHRY